MVEEPELDLHNDNSYKTEDEIYEEIITKCSIKEMNLSTFLKSKTKLYKTKVLMTMNNNYQQLLKK